MKWYQIRIRFLIPLFLVSFLVFIGYNYYYLPEGGGSSGYEVNAKPFTKIWSNKKIVLVGMGDSIVTGFGSGHKKNSFFEMITDNPEDDYPDIKNINLRKAFPNLEKINLAENSTASGDHILQVDNLEVQSSNVYGIVILSTGGIDLIHDYGNSPPQDEAIYGANLEEVEKYSVLFEQRLNVLIKKIKQKFPGGVKIFLFSIYDPTDGVGDIENVSPLLKLFKKLPKWKDGLYALNKWNEIIYKTSDENDFVELVDLHKAFLGHGIHCKDKSNPNYKPDDPSYWYYMNLEDPNRKGYDAIRRIVLLKMLEVFYKE